MRIRKLKSVFSLFLALFLASHTGGPVLMAEGEKPPEKEKKWIKWVDFDITKSAMEKALALDIASQDEDIHLPWIPMLAYLATRYGGDFSRFKEKDLTQLAKKLREGVCMDSLTEDLKHYPYYLEAYTAVLGGFVGFHYVQTGEPDALRWERRYGLKVFSPIARNYGFSHYDDFGAGRSYGYKRRHLGHDMMAATGTPIIAIESGVVEALGWNQYGGWRVGIRSFDQKRYYYYAHLRKNRPYHVDLTLGKVVKAGDVIGYLGRSGYSRSENTNNINESHLHVGMQLIFDESQKEGANEIWIDMYALTLLLQKNKSAVIREDDTKEYYRKYDFWEPQLGGSPPDDNAAA